MTVLKASTWGQAQRLRGHAMRSAMCLLTAAAAVALWIEVAQWHDGSMGAIGPVVIIVACLTVDRALAIALANLTVVADIVIGVTYARESEDLLISAAMAVAALAVGLLLVARFAAPAVPEPVRMPVGPPGEPAPGPRSTPAGRPTVVELPGVRISRVSHLLTRRQEEVLTLALRSLTARQIAQRLDISQRTVEAHLREAYRKLDVHSRGELAARLLE